MAKIKIKKQLNLLQVIEGIVQNDINNTFVELKSEYPAKQGIQIDRGGRLHIVGMDYLSKNNTFTVEVEEEITEETVIPKLVERCEYYGDTEYDQYEDVRIKDIKSESTVAFYIEHEDDLSLELIWLYEGLV